ncbi:MAG: addiction module toxin, RelE/StbE family [Bacilli bacterium]|nr:addiction module toxin, RelE/StbE family [Bacilli bacterium]
MSENKYNVKFTPVAIEDLDQIYAYISERLFADQAASELLEKIESCIMRLKEFPLSCSLVNETHLRSKRFRKLIVENYVVFYLVNEVDNQIVIMRVLYSAQKYQDLL